MPKNRQRVSKQPGAKSVAVRTKFKIGGRKTNKGAKALSNTEAKELLGSVRKRDRNKLRRVLESRGITC